MSKFLKEYKTNREITAYRITKRYRIPVKMDLLADLYLYCTIENRGFFIRDQRGEGYTCPQAVLLNGEKLMRSGYKT